jgi:hypothetical protein
MGWITTHRDKGITNDQWFQREVIGDRHEIVASSTVKGVYYAAVRTVETGEVWALVVLTQWAPRSYHKFGWKDMDETMGPGSYDAPAKVLNALTPTDNEWAQQWRAACREAQERKTAAATIAVGTLLRFAHPMMFTKDVRDVTELILEGKDVFRIGTPTGMRVRVPGWQQRAFEVVD